MCCHLYIEQHLLSGPQDLVRLPFQHLAGTLRNLTLWSRSHHPGRAIWNTLKQGAATTASKQHKQSWLVCKQRRQAIALLRAHLKSAHRLHCHMLTSSQSTQATSGFLA